MRLKQFALEETKVNSLLAFSFIYVTVFIFQNAPQVKYTELLKHDYRGRYEETVLLRFSKFGVCQEMIGCIQIHRAHNLINNDHYFQDIQFFVNPTGLAAQGNWCLR
jgi:hypothetical protein